MTNKDFDAFVRRRIQTEDMSMNKWSESRLMQQMQRPEVKEAARRFTVRTAVALVLLLGLLCGVALAAVTWNSREFLTYTEEDGTVHVNETLLEYVQPVGQSFENESLKVDVVDAIFDGHALVLTWTTQNKLDEQVYLLCDIRVNDGYGGQGSYGNVDEMFIAPGETVTSGISMRTDETLGEEDKWVLTDMCNVSMTFTAMLPHGEIVTIGAMEEGMDHDAYMAEISRLNAEGKLVVAPDGVIELGDKYPPYEEGMTRADIYEAAGVLTRKDPLAVTLSVEQNAQPISGLPEGRAAEKDNGDYILRVTKAELTPNSATFMLERIFPDQETAEKYANYYRIKHGPYWGFDFIDEGGDIWWAGNGGGGATTEEPVAQADGTWLWGYEATMTDMSRMPTQITVMPYRDNPDVDAEDPYNEADFHIEYPEEAIVLTFPQKP